MEVLVVGFQGRGLHVQTLAFRAEICYKAQLLQAWGREADGKRLDKVVTWTWSVDGEDLVEAKLLGLTMALPVRHVKRHGHPPVCVRTVALHLPLREGMTSFLHEDTLYGVHTSTDNFSPLHVTSPHLYTGISALQTSWPLLCSWTVNLGRPTSLPICLYTTPPVRTNWQKNFKPGL